MEKIKGQEKLHPWMGFVLFGIVMCSFLLFGVWMQQNLGIPGLILTEVMFLGIAIIYCLITHVDLREVFHFKKIKVRDFFGSMFMLAGGFLLSIISVGLVGSLLPSSMTEAAELSDFLYGSMGYIPTILIVAVLPAICEEAIHRGAIIANFRSLKRDWVIVLIMGLLFGIFHLSILRFLATAILGACLSYVVVKKNNLLLSMIMHFTNNLVSATMGYLTSGTDATTSLATTDMTQVLGAYLVIGFAAPILLTIGMLLIDPKSHRKIRFLYAGILSGAMLIAGIAINVANMSAPIVSSTGTYMFASENEEMLGETFNVEEGKTYSIVAVVTGGDGDYYLRIEGPDGKDVLPKTEYSGSIAKTISAQVELKEGTYTTYLSGSSGSSDQMPTFQLVIR